MMWLSGPNFIITIILTIIIIVCCVGIIIASRFQNKQEKKYKDCIKLIKEKGQNTFEIKDGLTNEDINEISDDIDINSLMKSLYDTYIEFVNKSNHLDDNFDNLLTGYIKDIFTNKIKTFKLKNCFEVIDGIDLINYSITEFMKSELKFRITINCFSYRKVNDRIVIGSNLQKVEQVLIVTYVKDKEKWLINNVDKVYEKKLGE